MEGFIKNIFDIQTKSDFEEMCMHAFHYQMQNNSIYFEYASLILKNTIPNNYTEIPFLPVEFFKQKQIICQGKKLEKIFLSSGTKGERSKHLVSDLSIYKESFTKSFHYFYGDINDYCILALLPSYSEHEDSSLIYMTDHLLKKTNYSKSNYYINNYEDLNATIQELEAKEKKTILFGVTYALLDFAIMYPQKLQHTIIMETGGMKGKKKELVKQEVHDILKNAFSAENIHSEYGMTELLSQAYSKKNNVFQTPPWMEVLIRDINDPLSINQVNTGGINIIDLANIYSCPFVATQDLGKLYENGFSILGRMKESDLRGCNLLI